MSSADQRRTATPLPRTLVVIAAIVIGILVLLMTTTVVGGMLAAREATAAATDTFSYAGDLTAERVGRYAESATDVVEGTAVSLERDAAKPRDVLAEELYLRLRREERVRAIYVGYADGGHERVQREGGGFVVQTLVTSPERSITVSTRDATFAEIARETIELDYDPRDRPWYTEGAVAAGTVWTDPYLQFDGRNTVVSAARAVRVDGSLVAVVGADLLIAPLGKVLDDLPLGEGAEAVVLSHDRAVIAAPGSYEQVLEERAALTGEVPTAVDVGIGVEAVATSARDGDVFGEVGDRIVLERAFPVDEGLDWILHLEAEAEALSPGLDRLETTVLWITGLSALVVVIAAVVAYRSWRPLLALRSRAVTDQLTGIANRHEFQRRGRLLVSNAHARGETAVVVVLDLDRFKQLNDTHGHDAGDRALAAVAEALEAAIRAHDIAARLGGDEFALVQTLNRDADVPVLVERVRASIEASLRHDIEGGDMLGVTAGFATSPDGPADLDALMRRADEALVAGKRQHKSRTYQAETQPA